MFHTAEKHKQIEHAPHHKYRAVRNTWITKSDELKNTKIYHEQTC